MVCQFCGTTHRVEHLTAAQLANGNDIKICMDCLRTAFYCDICGKIHSVRVGGKRVCPTCAEGKDFCHYCGNLSETLKDNACPDCNKKLKTCSGCGLRHMNINTTPLGELCEACITKAKLKHCNHCKTYHKSINWDNTHKCCKSCAKTFTTCVICGCPDVKRSMVKFYGDKYVCASHVRQTPCNCCGVTATTVVEYRIEAPNLSHRNEYLCGTCITEEKFGYIRNYSYKPAGNFLPHFAEGTLYFGVENEVTFPEGKVARLRMARVLQKLNPTEDLYYIKSDSSIPNGFEIVTHPFTFEYFKGQFPIDYMFPELEVPYILDGHCGMHIHITKSCLSNAAILKMLQFVADNKQFIELVAERSENSYCCAVKKEQIGTLALTKRGGDRGSVNLIPEQTVELRIFKGATTKEQYSKNVEFAHALVMFCSNMSLKNLKVDKFLEFIQKYPVQYVNLITFLRKHLTF